MTLAEPVMWSCYGACPRHGGDDPHCCEVGEEYRRINQERGSCNSSHGASCCVCNGPLPALHTHLNLDSPLRPRKHTGGCGGNVCSEGCLITFRQWVEREVADGDIIEAAAICPGHWNSPYQPTAAASNRRWWQFWKRS